MRFFIRYEQDFILSSVTEYGGLGLNYKYQAAYLEEMGTISCMGVGAGIIGHTEITLPALAR